MRPYVTLSWAQSLDGRIATATGDSQWIGGPESLTFAHELRRDNDAILVGIGTVLADNPRLTCRIAGGRNPQRLVLDARLRLPIDAALTDVSEAPTAVYTVSDRVEGAVALRKKGVDIRIADRRGAGLDLHQILADLGSRGIATLFVEGGAAVLTSFLEADLADRVVVVTAPFLIGAGINAVGDLGQRVLAGVRRPRWRRWELGVDLATELIFR